MKRLGAVLLLVALLALAPPVHAQATNQTLRIGWAQDPGSLNPFVGLDEEDYNIWSLTWDQLINVDPQTLKPKPGIAKSWTVSPDGLTVTYHLDPAARWSDGKPVTSADVKWSLQALGGHGALFTGYTTNIKSLDTPDAHTLVLHGKKPDTRFVGGLSVYILPKHIWGKVPLKQLTGNYKPKLPLVGSGPYIATQFQPGHIVKMERNPKFRGAPPPYAEVQFIKYGSQDATERALTLGEVDFVREVSAAGYARLGRQPNIDTRRAPSASFTQMAFNSCKGCPDAKFNPAVQDTTVRQAIAFGIDRNKLQEIASRRTSFIGHGLMPTYYKTFYEPPAQDYAYNPAKARQLLDAAGWKLNGGVRRKGNQQLKFNLYARSESPYTIQLAKLIAEMGKNIGVEFDVQVVSTDKLTELTTRKVNGKPAPEYDTFIWGWGGDAYDPSFLLSLITTSAIGEGESDSYYSNPQYDRLYAQQTTMNDIAKRKAVIHQMIGIAQRDLPYYMLTEDPRLQAYRTDRIAKIAPVCPARTGDLMCDQINWDGVALLHPIAAGVAGAAANDEAKVGSTGLGVLLGLGAGLLAGGYFTRRRYRRAAEPLELPE